MMKPLRRFAPVLALLLVLMPSVLTEQSAGAAPPTVTCDTDLNIFNTGYDAATGTYLDSEEEDANWEAAGRFDRPNPAGKTSLPPSDATWGPAFVGNIAPNSWAASPYSNAQWIAKEKGQSATGDWYYRYRFTIDPSVDPSKFSLSMNFLADNTVAEVFVNDVAQSPQKGLPQNPSGTDPYTLDGYKLGRASETLLDKNWRRGDNTLIVQIKSGEPYEGFLAQMRPSTLCPRPAIFLNKTANPTSVTAAGTKVKYSFEVVNSGTEPLTGVTVTESAFTGTGGAPTVSCPASALDPKVTMTCTAEYTVTQADYDAAKVTGTSTITNTASASGTPPAGPAVTSAPAKKSVIVSRLGIRIVKATTKPFVTDVGEQVPYTFTVFNTAKNIVKNLVVTDPKVGTVTCAEATIGPGKSTDCTGTYTVTQADLDAGRIINLATADAVDYFQTTKKYSDVSSEVVVPVLYRPGLSIVKASTTTTFNAVGQQVPYTFAVTNTGNVRVRDIAVNDPKVANPVCPLAELGAGEGTICTGSYTVTQGDLDAGHIVNQATVSGKTPADAEVTGASNRHVISANAISQLVIVKSTTTTRYDKVGQDIAYTFEVTNTGNQTLRDVKVTDPLLGGAVCTIPNLTPGARNPCTGSYRTTAADLDAGSVTNKASAAGINPTNAPVTASSNRVVVPAVYSPQLTMVKSSETTALDSAGAKVPYRFTIINTGNVTVDNVKVTDPHIADVTCPKASLPLGERMVCDGIYTVTPGDITAGQVVNQATVGGDVPAGGKKLDPTPSNEVIIRTAAASDQPEVLGGATQPGTTPPLGAPQPAAQLPRTGPTETGLWRLGLALLLMGAALWRVTLGNRTRPDGKPSRP